ncbi:hypothetical protein GCM10009846_28870 [Agrococcus versicolor]|uniref:Uncharacterized protein n=1 Tax=Agrococcus versicolor TaxID=501482 RepID=A0ABP5MNI7_9MICO
MTDAQRSDAIGLGEVAVTVWSIAKWPVLWLWIVNLALLLGAEFDAELERGRQLQGGIEAEDELQLPPRDTRQIEKQEQKRRRLVDEGYRLRRRRGSHGERHDRDHDRDDRG